MATPPERDVKTIPTLKGSHLAQDFDPFRVGTILLSVPVALPPAIELDASGVRQKLLNVKVATTTIPQHMSSLESIRVTSVTGSECKPLNDFGVNFKSARGHMRGSVVLGDAGCATAPEIACQLGILPER